MECQLKHQNHSINWFEKITASIFTQHDYIKLTLLWYLWLSFMYSQLMDLGHLYSYVLKGEGLRIVTRLFSFGYPYFYLTYVYLTCQFKDCP